jgi:hypothetical protein
MENDDHAEVFEQIMQDYNFMLSMEQWATSDLVKLANLIDIELQQRAEAEQTLREQEANYNAEVRAAISVLEGHY